MFNDTCTIYNKYTDSSGLEKWQRTVLDGVFWESVRGSNLRKTGLENTDSVFALVPNDIATDKAYLSPKDWITLVDKINNWTLQPGDTIIKGPISYEVVKSSKEIEQFDDCFKITKVDYKSFGDDMAHWEVGAK